MVDLKKHGPTIALLFTMLVMLSYGIEWIRVTVGLAMDAVLGPFIDTLGVPFFVMIQKEFREAQLSGDEKRVKKLQGKQERMMQDQLDLSRQQFTPMAIILVLSVPIFFWLLLRLPEVGTPVAIASGIVMPFLGAVSLSEMAFWIVPAWILWYMICSLTVSQVIRKSLNIGGL